ncbi:LamG domain-containing protein [Micromonospora sp. NPDC048871]|uniref:LamG domain-containing protein n=1 Tax=unclassified Micromonospora TaxID=2617518 RepID=UPI002E0EBBA0|nr:LamG domain-containing protein [Micromonospora sp. NBC_01739]
MTASSERAAQALAASCETEVEVLAAASETTKVFAQPSGDFAFESWVEPQWVEQDGAWAEIDTTLEAGADGLIRPVASTAEVVFSAGGTGPFATMTGAGATFSLGWPDALPPGVITDDTITYPNVYPDVDLVVRAERGGFSHLLVVKSAAAAANPLVRETPYVVGGSAEVAVVDGSVTISGPDGVLAGSPPAVAWDSPETVTRSAGFLASHESIEAAPSTVRGPADSALVTPVEVRLEGDSLTVAADPEVLEAGSFPIFIDPTYDKKWSRWAPVNDSRPDTQWTSGTAWPRETARVGSNYDSHGDIWRAHFYFDTTVLAGKRLVGTTSVDAYLVHTGWCAGESIGIWQTNSIASNTPTWNGMKNKWLHDGPLQTRLGKANASCGQDPDWLSFNGSKIGHHVQRHANAGYDSITFGLRMGSESGGRWAKFNPNHVKLKATYEHKPTSPVAVRTSPGGNCAASPGPWITNRTPTLFGKAKDGDGTVRVQFDLNGPTSPAVHLSAWTKSDSERAWPTPTLTEGNYNWRVRGTDMEDGTDWTGWCYFRLDHTPPTAPVVARMSDSPVVGEPVTLKLTSSDARSGLRRFAYGIGVDAQQHFVNSTGTTTITFTPESGRTHVYVWAQDNAGNYSARTEFNFYSGRSTEAQLQGAWRFNGDAIDDSGQSGHLELGSGIGYGPDRAGSPDSALTFDGTDCAQTSPVIRTDSDYTVAAWAKLTSTSGNRAVVAQAGSAASAFVLGHDAATNRWQVSLAGADSANSGSVVASAPAAAVGQWQHLAATVDPLAKVVRLYVGGVLASQATIDGQLWHAEGRLLIGCAGSQSSSWHHMTGSIDQVGIWQGLLSDAQIGQAATELPAGEIGNWPLHGDGTETTERSTALVLPQPASWAEDQYGRLRSAAQFTGTQCARTEEQVVRTHESFSIAAWVKLDSVGTGSQTIIGQDGDRVSGWFLGARYLSGAPYWALMMKPTDDEYSLSHIVRSSSSADAGTWTHLVGVYNATDNRLSLYVNGTLAASAVGTGTPWRAEGPLTVGCARHAGVDADHVNGAVSAVRAWQGALTADEVKTVYGGNPAVKLEGMWPLEGPASDMPTHLQDMSGNGRDLSVPGPYSWGRDRAFGQDGALLLSDHSCAEAPGPAVRTDASFTVAAWVFLEQTTGHHTVVGQAAGQRGGFDLKYLPDTDRWQFELSSAEGDDFVWHKVMSTDPPLLDEWTHLAGVFDVAAGKVRLYVNGALQGEADGPTTPWMANGPTLIGCSGATNGDRWSPLQGLVDDVRIWTSTLAPERIANLAEG